VLFTELSRWGRSTTDLLATLKKLEARRVSVIALNGMAFDLATPHGRMIATALAGIAGFERELSLSKNTVAGIVKRNRTASASS
jgi:putative DNA-invertase from lambdoid prophage Rac